MTTPVALPKLKQEDFDEVVQTNIDTFDMGPEEAIASAVKEFEMQKYDLSSVIQTVEGGKIEKHPIAMATNSLTAALDTLAAAAGPAAIAGLQSALAAMTAVMGDFKKEKKQEGFAVANRAGSVAALVAALRAAPAEPAVLLSALALLRGLFRGADARAALLAAGGCELLLEMLTAGGQDASVLAAVGRTAAAAAKLEEDNKNAFVDNGFAAAALDLLRLPSTPLAVAGGACACLRALCNADDLRPPASRAFQTARNLAKNNASTAAVMDVLKRVRADGDGVPAAGVPTDAAALSDALLAVRQLAVNEEICREFADCGLVETALALLRGGGCANAGVAEAGCSALRQLAMSDYIKAGVASAGGLAVVIALMEAHPGHEGAAEGALGLLAAITLRMPDTAAAAAEAGCADVILGAMTGPAASQATTMRQACMAVRNIVARCPELRPLFLERGAEAALRAAKNAHPRLCQDVGYAALRDLGLDNYMD